MDTTATVQADLKRGDAVVYTADDPHRGMVGKVTRLGLDVLGEPAVEVVFRYGRRSSRKQVRVSRLSTVDEAGLL